MVCPVILLSALLVFYLRLPLSLPYLISLENALRKKNKETDQSIVRFGFEEERYSNIKAEILTSFFVLFCPFLSFFLLFLFLSRCPSLFLASHRNQRFQLPIHQWPPRHIPSLYYYVSALARPLAPSSRAGTTTHSCEHTNPVPANRHSRKLP